MVGHGPGGNPSTQDLAASDSAGSVWDSDELGSRQSLMAFSEILKSVPKVTYAAAYGSAVVSQVKPDVGYISLNI